MQESWRHREQQYGSDEPDWRQNGYNFHYDQSAPSAYHLHGNGSEQGSRSDYWRGQEEQHHYYYDQGYQHAYPASTSSGYTNSSAHYDPPREANYSTARAQEYHYEGGPSSYHRRAYRPTVVLSDYYAASTPNSPQRSHYSTASYGKERESSLKHKNTSLRSKPRKVYHSRTLGSLKDYSTDVEPPGPLPLLVLDLNGTLVNRGSKGGSNTTERSKKPILRPYLKSFLQYCLGVQRTDTSSDEHQDEWDEWESKQGKERGKDLPHGAHFWKSQIEPQVQEKARFRLLLWSSAQPHNVDSMARAILSPEQAEQLLRVYARDTLVNRRLYAQKAPSIKDLEILWSVLNNKSIGKEGERRLFAEAREKEDDESPDEDDRREQSANGGASNESANRAQEDVVFPKVHEDGHYEGGAGYGQHNTLLLDDSVDKARLQPFNHILLPEFDQSRAQKTIYALRKSSSEANVEQEEEERNDLGEVKGSDDERRDVKIKRKKKRGSEVDDVLLQVIGVLEHARFQANVSSWIRFGGLGDFGGMQKEHPYYLEDDLDGLQVSDDLVEEVAAYFSSSATPQHGPHLRATTEQRTEAFWAEEGKAALKRHNISLQRF
ncbi:hypothetical protein CBS101457_005236 [Exobasidium rhododendri]|nr:hypothetical protein CBS101457_005236 [Exobasidium rhododendri]